MKKWFTTFIICMGMMTQSFGWGQNGHRVIGQIAEWHLNKKALKKIEAVLSQESLPMVANWMDEIRSDKAYDHTHTWHYLTVPEGKGYDPALQEENGDAYATLLMLIDELKSGHLSAKKEAEYLKMLVHIVGDLHQPLHVGTGEDRGGNDVEVYYFNQKTNLHSVWDTEMIESQKLCFTEIARHLNKSVDNATIEILQSAKPSDWLEEAKSMRSLVYDLPDDKKLSYDFNYKNYGFVEDRLLAGGIRLAGILNEIYG